MSDTWYSPREIVLIVALVRDIPTREAEVDKELRPFDRWSCSVYRDGEFEFSGEVKAGDLEPAAGMFIRDVLEPKGFYPVEAPSVWAVSKVLHRRQRFVKGDQAYPRLTSRFLDSASGTEQMEAA